MNKFEYLANKTCKDIVITEGFIGFELEDSEVISFAPMGDCCSNSWIEHFDQPVTPCLIYSFKQIEISPSFEETPTKTSNIEEEIRYYFYEINTDKGSFLIEMRNSSNGYYGGWLE